MEAISGGLREACSENNGQLNFDKVEHLKSIKTPRKLPDGIYIRGSVQGYPIIFTADTGASRTIISRGTYEAMDPADKPVLVKSARLVGPTGTVIDELGQGTFSLKMGEVEIEVEAVVADIDDDGLLGIDVLQNGNGGPTDLLLSKGVVRVQDEKVPPKLVVTYRSYNHCDQHGPLCTLDGQCLARHTQKNVDFQLKLRSSITN